jgi:hypothetical protein
MSMTQNCSCHGAGDTHSQTVTGLLERPRYSPGLILEDGDLTAAVDYGRSLSRLLFRNLFGCGVVCGLVVRAEKECGLQIRVEPGLALDGCGDPIEVPGTVTIALDRAKVDALESQWKNNDKDPPPEFWVVLCGKEKMCKPRSLVCDADEFDGATQPTRIRALAEVSLSSTPPQCVCGCQQPPHTPPLPPQSDAQMKEVECHDGHKNRAECAPDCGCGTACSCGCCVLLGRVVAYKKADGTVDWRAMSRGYRRFIRPAMLPDPADRPENWVSPGVAGDFYLPDISDRDRKTAMDTLYPGRHPGSVIDHDMAMNIVDWTIKRRAEHAEAAAKADAERAKAAAASVEAEKKAKVNAENTAKPG